MSIVPQTIVCDECGKLRANDVNHWLVLTVMEARDLRFDWLEKCPMMTGDRHACGIECAIKLLSRWFEENRK